MFLNMLLPPIPFFGDIGWFYLSARDAILLGKFPLLGITSSITWLHQGPLWTYMIIPAFILSNFHPLSPVVLMVILNIFLIPCFYFLILKLFNKKTALLSTFLLALFPWWTMHSHIPYHTSPIPLFEVIFLLCLIKQRDFLTGLFLGFLYQLHLLTFIFWPIYPLLNLPLFRGRHPVGSGGIRFILGFLLGILPFIISGPIQTLGIFVWIIKHILVGFGGSGLTSEAYRVVLFIPALILLSLLTHKLPKLLNIIIFVSLLIFGHLTFDINKYAPFYSQYLESVRSGVDIYGQNSKFASAVMPFQYLTWWLSRVK